MLTRCLEGPILGPDLDKLVLLPFVNSSAGFNNANNNFQNNTSLLLLTQLKRSAIRQFYKSTKSC